MDWFNLFVVGLVGLAVGSFLNVCIDRLPAGLSLVSPPSHCSECQTALKTLDLVPVASYLALRGRCRYCSARIPLRSPLVEATTAVIFALIWAGYGPSYEAYALMGYAAFFLAILVIDVEHEIIPNVLVFPGFAVALVVASFWPELGLARAAIGAGAGFGILLAMYLIPGAVIGEGDVKLAAVVGAVTGFPLVVVGLAMAFVLGGVIATVLLVSGRRERKGRMAFGPFIAIGAVVTLVWGEPVLDWYLTRFLSL